MLIQHCTTKLFYFDTKPSQTRYGCDYKVNKCVRRKTWPSSAFFYSHFEIL